MNWSSNWETVKPGTSQNIVGIPAYNDDKTAISVIQDNKVLMIFNVFATVLSIRYLPASWPIDVDVMQVGDLAIHEGIGSKEKGQWRITHVPTLTKFDTALPPKPSGVEYTQDKLILWAAMVQAFERDEWKLLATLTPITYDHDAIEVEECKEAIKQWCQSVKV